MAKNKATQEENLDEASAVPSKDELEKVDANAVANEGASFPAPKLVNLDNGSQTFQDSEVQKVTHPEIVQGAFRQDNTAPKNIYVDNIETPMVMRETRIIDERLKKADFKRVMDELAASNPEKFAAQKDDLQKQMDAAPE